ncbi:MAG: chorismate synthase [Chloroflexota bacterium]
MTLRHLRLLTSGESHGPGMSGILDGLPAGLRVSTQEVDRDLARRQHGHGSGRRMRIERDRVADRRAALRAHPPRRPLAFIPNLDWASWTERMSVEPIPATRSAQAHHPRTARARGPRGRHQVRHRRHPRGP